MLASIVDAVFLGGADLDGADLADVAPRLLAMVGLLAARGGCSWLTEVTADRASGRLRTDVRRELVDHLVAVGPATLTEQRTGEVATTIGAGVEALHGYATRFVPAAVLAVVSPLIVFVAVAVLDPWTTLILLFTGPMLVLLLAVIGGRTRVLTQRRFDELGWLGAFYLDMVRGLGTLKAFRRSSGGADTIERASRRFGDTTMEVLRTAFQTSLVMEWAATAATALAAVEISFRMVEGNLSFGTAFATLVLIPEFFVPFRRLALEYHSGQTGQAALARIDDALALPITAPARPSTPVTAPDGTTAAPSGATAPSPAAAPSREAAPNIELCDVDYRYPGAARSALDSLSLTLAAGETVALTGPSGAGKSTVARVLLRFVEPTGGRVLVDGEPLDGLDPAAWRRRVAWVPQDPTLVAGTVADNIALGDPGADRAAIRAAADVARATDFIDALPDGFDTLLG
ncbi:MAG: ABC transporter ATP-binding protein/permease, partial [Microthrixaceae bacterium]